MGRGYFEVRSFFENEISNQINFANSERHISEVLTHKDPIHTPITLFEFGLLSISYKDCSMYRTRRLELCCK